MRGPQRWRVLVGAGSGIGRAVLDAFLSEGARVVVLELEDAKRAALSGIDDDVVAVAGDATSLADNRHAVRTAVETFGGLDVLATFVGVFDYYTTLVDLPDEAVDAAFDEIFRTNVLSPLLSVKAAVEPLRESGGAVVLTLSTSSFYPGRGGPLYVGTKFAGRGLVLQLAHELAPEVRVNAVAPGGTLGTELRGLHALGSHERTLGSTPGPAEELASRTPLEVALSGADHAGGYVFLASDRCRGTMGDIIHSDGGIGVRG